MIDRPYQRLRRAADRFVHHPWVEVTILLLILLSVGLTMLELAVAAHLRQTLVLVGDAITGLFVVELLLRFWVARKKRRFFERYWIDILAVLPLIRPLRFFRVLRVLRLFRAGALVNRRMSAFSGRYLGTGSDLLALAVGTVVLVILCAMVLFLAEGGTSFAAFDDALWFSAYSLVGGEPIGGSPSTEVGRWTTLLLMLGGLSLFGVFVGTVSAGMVTNLSRRMEVHELDLDELQDHVVVCGWNQSGPTVLHELFGSGSPTRRCVVLVTEHADPPDDLPTDGIRREHLYHHHGDYTRVDVLERVGIRVASSVILLADELVPRSAQDCDARTVLAALTIERMAPTIYTVAELHARQNEELLRMAGVEEIVVADLYAGMIIGTVQRNQGLVTVLDEILTGRHGNGFETRQLPATWAGIQVAELHRRLLLDHRATLVSVEIDGRTVVNPDPDAIVPAGSRLVLVCGRDLRRLPR